MTSTAEKHDASGHQDQGNMEATDMTSKAEEHDASGHHDQGNMEGPDGDTVVISGVSTVMPGCHNIMEFSEKLYGKVNMAKCGKPRWDRTYPELPEHHGFIPKLDHFDAQFFMVYQRLCQVMDAMTRKLLEHSYQAVFDAGICPTELSGKRIGVFISAGFGETEKSCYFSELYLGIVGSNRSMTANRISYYLNLKGPSIHVDGDAAGTAVVLDKAFQSIATGECEAAIVGGSKLLLHMQSSIHYNKLIPLCQDGNVKSFDKNADGHALSESVSCIFLQKYKDAKRVYASIKHVKARYSETIEGQPLTFGPYHDPAILTKFLNEFYEEANVKPSDVEYVEGYGSAIPDADKSELEAIDAVFCKDRTDVLPVGSVMSNAGYTDATSCLTAIMKLILAYNTGTLAANINCSSPRVDVEGLQAGRLRIVTEDMKFNRSMAAINNFSNTGINAHVLLQGHFKEKDPSKYHSNIPYLVVVSGRHESAVRRILNDIKSRRIDPEEIALLNNIHKSRIPKHLARGFGIYATSKQQKTITVHQEVDYYDEKKKPLWFVYSGMGSQCHKALESKGVDLINVITCTDNSIFDNILNSFIGIAAIQIGLTDILKAIGLVPDNIIGHSVGELGCAYADACVTAEEMILMAYSRGLVSRNTPFIRGSMAAVGLGFKQISNLLPPEIEVACHNSAESCTISGPAAIMKSFVEDLKAQGIFAKEVACSNIAYHSRYIAEAGPELLACLRKVIKSPKARSERWLSTSVPEDRWSEPFAKFSSAEYHTNNLLSPVLFEEILKLVPPNAVLVEIAPHGLLQAILKRCLPESCKSVPLTRREHKDNIIFMLEAIGKLYMEGFDLDISALYPKIDFPVSTETRPISHLVEWANEKFTVCQYVSVDKKNNSVYRPVISIYDEEYEYLAGNVIDGRRVFLFSGALIFVWETLAMTIGKQKDHLSVEFRDVTFHNEPILFEDQSLHLSVLLQRGGGRFEVTYEHGIIADGYIEAIITFNEISDILKDSVDVDSMELNNDDIYRLLFEKGYQYRDDFRSIHKANMSLNMASLKWKNNWVTFLDGIIQMNVLRREHEGISQPLYAKRICIDAMYHAVQVHAYNNNTDVHLDAVYSRVYNSTRCGGLLIEHLTFKDKPSLVRQAVALKELKFIPFIQESNNDVLETLYIYLQIISENLNKDTLNVIWISDSEETNVLEEIQYLLTSHPVLKLNIITIKKNKINKIKNDNLKPDFILLNDIYSERLILEALYHSLPPNTFIINIGAEVETMYPTALYRKICVHGTGKERVELSKWKPPKAMVTTAAISVNNNADLEHLRAMKAEMSNENKLMILAPYPPPYGLIDLVQEWRKETGSNNLFVVMINKNSDNIDDIDFPSCDLVFNVLDGGLWRGAYYIPVKEKQALCEKATLRIASFGQLSTLSWIQAPDIVKEGIKVTVKYAGLNVYDARRATAEISIKDSKDRGFGMDFSGVTENGARVMGLVKGNAVSKEVLAKPDLLWPVPEHWSLEDAATVPLPYCLAFHCLAIKSRLVRGMNVLIHGGAGALGQAAISICLSNEINVFTTVSNVHKKMILRKLFPNLPADHIGNSRDTSFQDMVIKETMGERCHIIICSVPGELKQATLNCCAMSGITIDTCQIHMQENFSYGMFNMTKSRSYTIIDFASIFANNDKEEMKLLQLLVSEGIARGYVRPLSRVTYPPEEVPRALRLLAASRHLGRVLLRLEDSVPVVQSRINCSSDGYNMIFCDNDYFGLQIADRLVTNGAKKLFIHCTQYSNYLELKKILWKKLGVQVHIFSEKLYKKEHTVKLLKDCIRKAPIEGIFIVKTKLGNTESVIEARNLITDLDSASRELCPLLRYFTVVHENELGNDFCLNRAQRGLHSLSFRIHHLQKFNENRSIEDMDTIDGIKWPCAVDAIEKAMTSDKVKVVTYPQPVTRQNLTAGISEITGIPVTDSTSEDLTLEDIGVDKGKAQLLSNMLQEKFNILVSKDNVVHMTISELKTLQKDKINVKEEVKGLAAYINFVDPDELQADSTVQMHTLVTSQLRPIDFDNELTYLCIVPGIEGLHHRFFKLCERLKLPALVLQPGFDVTDHSVQEMAQRLADVMLKKLKLKRDFYLLGYEFGILVAMELAQILEKRGYTGTIYCVGGTPEDICSTLGTQFGNTDPAQLQNDLIHHAYTLITKTTSDVLNAKLQDTEDWEVKVEVFMDMINGQCSFSKQYLRCYINAIYNRILLARDYVWDQRLLKSKVVVLKAKLPVSSTDSSTTLPYTVHELHTTLPHALDDLKCSAIVNKYLDPNILEEFDKGNHCETVLVHESEEFVFNYIDDD
ncbi:acyl transferase domain-containing protein [Phthorimaea operculella]|nr:acyl transferase domain-containing protein [Phthorimaea operculella]